MSIHPQEYQELVIDDIKTYVGLFHPVQAGLIERLMTKTALTSRCHPNPVDEFSMPEIGPNYEIVGNYEKQLRYMIDTQQPIMLEPLMIEKMSTGGYLLLNGHHRWLAAHRIRLHKLPVRLVNVTHEEEVLQKIACCDKERCVSIDLDEVLLVDGSDVPDRYKWFYLLRQMFHKSIKKNASVLIEELQKSGYSVWVYTGKYYSVQFIEALLFFNHIKANGIINGLSTKKSSKNLKQAFRQKYSLSLHLANDSLICVNTRTKEYEVYEIQGTSDEWSAEMIQIIKTLKD